MAFLTRQLGREGPQVAALGFGAMGLGAFYGSVLPDEERLKVLDRAHELGATHWDTAELYGDSESIIGKWFKRTGKRNEIFLATKFGAFLDGKGGISASNKPDYIRSAVNNSLERLQTDYIDLYYCHNFTGEIPIEEVTSILAEFVKAGKVRHIGFSEVSSENLRRAAKIHPVAAHQVEYSPWTTYIEEPKGDILSTNRELGIATIAYSPLGRGIMTGQYKSRADFEKDDWRLSNPRFSEENFGKNLVLVAKIEEIAKAKGVTPGQLTLAWLLKQGSDIIPIPGTKNIKYLEQNMGSLGVELTKEEEKDIRALVEAADVAGTRY